MIASCIMMKTFIDNAWYVKKFVITEATYTHNGKKDLNFDINKFKKFKDKIDYIIVDKQLPDVRELSENDQQKSEKKINIERNGKRLFSKRKLKNGLKYLDQMILLLSVI